MADSASISTVILLTLAAALLLALVLYPSSLVRWLQRKRYQYEVTFSLYMLTSTEKFILSTQQNPFARQQAPSITLRLHVYTAARAHCY
jgi:predicted PurR-regulated permease PerM